MKHLHLKQMIVLPLTLLLLVFCMASCSHRMTPQVSTAATSGTDPVLQTRTYKEKGYTLTFKNNDPSFDTSIREKLVRTFFIVYPKEARRFNKKVPKSIVFSMDTAYHGVAATGHDKTTFSAAYYHKHPHDIDVVTHEVMHIVQGYPHYHPVWLVEGIADYARYVYGVHNKTAGWILYDYSDKQSYKNSYRICARFLVWLSKNVDKKIVDQLDSSLRDDTYTSGTWKKLTGKTVDELWAAYGKDPALQLHYR
ncbi:MAG TPA: basic secretory protein-like protein [Chitinophagaceae bacterium]|jgi:hypothetical protein|nr:basic secretory protein-like protein [Chitinophagaceae bacterium]